MTLTFLPESASEYRHFDSHWEVPIPVFPQRALLIKGVFVAASKTYLLRAIVLAIIITASYLPSLPIAKVEAAAPRTIVYQFHDFFKYPYTLQQQMDIWQARESKYAGEFRVVSYGQGNGIFVHIWEEGGRGTGKIWYYAPVHLQVTGRNLPEFNIDTVKQVVGSVGHRAFLPYNLMGSTPSVVSLGTASANWYLEHVNKTEAARLGLTNSYDGYATELRGTVVMDVPGAQKILGTSASSTAGIESWFLSNEASIEDNWVTWLNYEGNVRVDIFNAYGSTLLGAGKFPNQKPLDLGITVLGTTQVELTINLFYWGMETLLARWFRETFMPGYEYGTTDTKLSFQIDAAQFQVDLDTVVEWGLYMWSQQDIAYNPSAWSLEAVLADFQPSGRYGPAYHYAPDYDSHYYFDFFADSIRVVNPGNGVLKTYYNTGPGHASYNSFIPYDYVPSAFNLELGETLVFNYSTTRNIWVLDQTPTGLSNRTGILGVGRIEPVPQDIPATQIDINYPSKTITIRGPFDMASWSYRFQAFKWLRLADSYRPNGVLPWGAPYVEFNVIPSTAKDGDVNGDRLVDIYDQAIVGRNYGRTLGMANYDPRADTYLDGKIDILDLVRIGLNFGKTV